MKKTTYLFLCEEIYSPKEVKIKFGSPVEFTKREGDEIWFQLLNSEIKGYVVYPSLFILNTKENRAIVRKFNADIKNSQAIQKAAWKRLNAIPVLS